MQKKVFIIIVSYNGEQWLFKNLQSLNKSTYPVTTIVVDNYSSDTSKAIVKLFPEVTLISLNKNLGFGLANNIAIKEAMAQDAAYVFLLNQDTWVFPETIGNLVAIAETNKEFGIISPLHYSGDGITLDKNFEKYWKGKNQDLNSELDDIPFVNAAAWFIPKKVIEKVGLFEPLYTHYGEDRNYVSRVLFHNFRVGIVKDSKICHDRVIKRNFRKDAIQSKYKILTEVLNINNSLFVGYLRGFMNVLGLPKYFYKYYSLSSTLHIFIILFWYYVGLLLNLIKIFKTRSSHK